MENNNQSMYKLIILLSFIFLTDANQQSITLDGKWTGIIASCNEASSNKCDNGKTFPAVVPGGVYSDLYRSNIIPENLIGPNDIKNRWVGNQTVIYIKSFNVSEALFQSSKTFLVFHGLDTFATIILNGIKVGETSNMFVKYTFDVKEHLKVGKNDLEVVFSSPVKMAEMLFNDQRKRYVVPPLCTPKEYNGECHVNHIRKMQASFSWDWGPAFPSMGIWKSVELNSVNNVLVTDVTTDIYNTNEEWKVYVTVFFKLGNENVVDCHISSTLFTKHSYIQNSTHITLSSNDTYANATIVLTIPWDQVDRWWPNGYGAQNLYKLKTSIVTTNEVITKEIRIGFRTVELVQMPLRKGLSFFFRINGLPIFAKGSNYIPASVFPESIGDKNTIENLLRSAKDTYMNMLRVWGGGIYESELFYDLADEYGIMIWQDFMFACAMYPTTENFTNTVREEILQNVRRLKNHVSIVLWAGNNENEAALYGNWYGTGTAPIYRDDYIKLYVNLIKEQVEQLDSTRPFVVSSPSNGLYAETYNYTGQDPYSNLFGDVHYYNYIRNGWDVNQYPRPRFSSEYGFQSIPSLYTLSTAAESIEDLQINSTFMSHRQHLQFGNQILFALVSKNFRIPQSNNLVQDFSDFIYLSQINQAVSVQIQTESYRQAMTEVDLEGEGLTMGALYWQLNDVWQAPSWSSIEYGGRWKMLHYYAKNFFAPVIVTSRITAANELILYVVSDLQYEIKDCSVKIMVHNWNSTTPVHSRVLSNVVVEPYKSKVIELMWLNKYLAQSNCGSLSDANRHCMMSLVLQDSYGIEIAPVNYVYPAGFKYADLPYVNITAKISKRQLPGKLSNYPDFQIELTTNGTAFFVWLELGKIQGRFSDNGFHMFQPCQKVVFYAQELTTPELIRAHLKITTLSNIYMRNRVESSIDIVDEL